MPLYEYQCEACAQRFEVIQKFSDPPATVCRVCGSGPVRKLLSSPAIQFKGSGWYVTDYARKSGDSTASTSTSDSSQSAETSKKESSSTDSAAAKPSTPTSKD
ncbi:MAG TPA: zinc ribbon domain-containing protein [Vicinamibacterales bacterium]|jgi:putative FmdB family regulatory protein|nr:zinc ribbon domain-containing protein [Vicinamibacterales bacterium]